MAKIASALALLAVLVLSGCGSPPERSAEKTKTCLQDAGLTVAGTGGDIVADTATGGAFRVRLGPNSVTLAFGADTTEAASTVEGYRRFHSARSFGLDNLLFTDRNVVLLWKAQPTPDQTAKITDCLK